LAVTALLKGQVEHKARGLQKCSQLYHSISLLAGINYILSASKECTASMSPSSAKGIFPSECFFGWRCARCLHAWRGSSFVTCLSPDYTAHAHFAFVGRAPVTVGPKALLHICAARCCMMTSLIWHVAVQIQSPYYCSWFSWQCFDCVGSVGCMYSCLGLGWFVK
jgi:hypothetical protein